MMLDWLMDFPSLNDLRHYVSPGIYQGGIEGFFALINTYWSMGFSFHLVSMRMMQSGFDIAGTTLSSIHLYRSDREAC